MAFPKRIPVPTTNGISTIDATVINGWNVDISNAVDGGSGGVWSPLAELDITGLGFGFTLPSTGSVSGLGWPTFNNDLGSDGHAASRSFDRVHSCVDARFASGWAQI